MNKDQDKAKQMAAALDGRDVAFSGFPMTFARPSRADLLIDEMVRELDALADLSGVDLRGARLPAGDLTKASKE